MPRCTAVAAVVLAAVAARPAAAQAPASIAYRAAELACTRFTEAVRTRVRGQSESTTLQSRAGRDGLLVLTVRDTLGSLMVEAWYDSLTVWREDDADRVEPSPDGFLGGRYRGTLTADGRYRSLHDPFVPAEVAEVADLAATMDDFLPRLPPVRLVPGGEWRDSVLVIRRIGNRRVGAEAVERYQWTATARRGDRYPAADSLEVTLDQLIEEQGELLWSPAFGPLSWSRKIKITARIPRTGGVRRSIRSIVDQEVDVVRRPEIDSPCR